MTQDEPPVPAYLKDFAKVLKEKGARAYLDAAPSPMLVLLGLARQLRDGPTGEKTTVATSLNEELEASALVGRVFFVAKAVAGSPGPVSLGRTSETDVHIPEYSISKRHCEILRRESGWAIRDTGSTNGTELDGEKLVSGLEAPLVGGETLVLGRFAFRFDTPQTLLERLRARD
ncbi:MAG: FHA domain-containing protein [Myxococcales bacterium]|nr:FHA domain-containing protein [Myxococcales bacterium]